MQYSNWYGFNRCDFDFMGHEAFIVEPPQPLPEKKWSWCLEWPKAFVERCGALELLKRGFHHVHVNINGTWASPEGMKVLNDFYKFLVEEKGFAAKAALMGLSRGGICAYRFAMEYPERVAVIYGDAPVCDLAKYPKHVIKEVYAAYGCETSEDIAASGLNPIDNLDRLVKCHIPIIHVIGCADEVVDPAEHTDVHQNISERRRRRLP